MKLPTHNQLTVSTAAQDRMLWTSPFRTKQEVVVEIKNAEIERVERSRAIY